MIIVTTRIYVAMGKMSVGLDWAERVTKILSRVSSPTSKWWLLRSLTSNPNAFAFVGEYASMAEFEEFMNKAGADPAYLALIKEMAETDWALSNERTISQVVKES